MSVEVRLPALLRRHVQGKHVVEGQGTTVGELLENLEKRYPGLRRSITAENGMLHQFVNIYVNDEDMRYLRDLDTPLNPGDVVSILPAVAGGN